MLHCINLAKRATGLTKTNPRVGCLIIWEDIILAEGWHQYFGGMHAEAHALSCVPADKKHLLQESTLFVSLEPCNHFGKTPPCSEAIVKSGIKTVIIGCEDPNPMVSGKGIQYLRNAGIEVTVGIEKKACEELIRPFVTLIKKNRPFIILKWAQSADGFIGKKNESAWLSNSSSKRKVHKIRSEVDGILVGAGTIEADNPELTTRFEMGRSPEKIILDSSKALNPSYTVFNSGTKTILISSLSDQSAYYHDVEILSVPESPEKNMEGWLKELKNKNIGTILVEGGAKVLQSFIDQGLWDEAIVIHCPINLEQGIKAPQLKDAKFDFKSNIHHDVWHTYLSVNNL